MNTQSTDRKYHQAIAAALDGLDEKNPGFNYAALTLAKLAEDTHVPKDGRPAVVESLKRVGKKVADIGIHGHSDTIAAQLQIDRAVKSIQAQSGKDGNGVDKIDEVEVAGAAIGPAFTQDDRSHAW
ncbi:hypothetical protein C4585_02770 [Candidatus Parcubacteria bacterium]|nr:MAG: hypothetical protein C4585_02770 [Candidatus Parcubacteria bacterium]